MKKKRPFSYVWPFLSGQKEKSLGVFVYLIFFIAQILLLLPFVIGAKKTILAEDYFISSLFLFSFLFFSYFVLLISGKIDGK